jgi:hypothetical protein
MFDGVHQQIKCPLSVWLNQLELLREAVFVRLDVVAVLHLVEPVCRMPPALMVPLLAPLGKSSSDGTRIGAGMKVDRQQRVHRAGNSDHRLADLAGRRDVGEVGADIRGGQPSDVAIGSSA